MMYGQMTAGSWIYIGTQGILQGTYETFAAAARAHFGADATSQAGCVVSRRARRHGRRAAARGDDGGGVFLGIEVDPSRIEQRLETALPRRAGATISTTRSRRVDEAKSEGQRRSRSGSTATRARPARARAARHRPRPRHRADLGARSARRLRARGRRARRGRLQLRQRDPRGLRRAGAPHRWPNRSRPCSRCRSTGAARLRLRQQHPRPGRTNRPAVDARSTSPASCPAYIRPLFCEGKGPFRWVALSGDPADIARHRRGRARGCSPTTRSRALDRARAGARAVPGPAGAHLLARLRRARRVGPRVQRARARRARSRRRSSSAAITSTAGRSRRPTARPKR